MNSGGEKKTQHPRSGKARQPSTAAGSRPPPAPRQAEARTPSLPRRARPLPAGEGLRTGTLLRAATVKGRVRSLVSTKA